MSRCTPRVACLAWAVLLACLAPLRALAAQDPAPSKRAGEILKASGAQGGLIVHLGCGDGRLTAALGRNKRYLVHGLESDAAMVGQARRHFRAEGLCGRVSVSQLRGPELPYVGNFANAIVVTSGQVRVPRDEMMRILAPRGVLVDARAATLQTTRKPWPARLDEWTHYLHDATNNAVSRDTAITAPIRHLQWQGSPRYGRHHDKSSSFPATVTAGGRIYYVADEGPRASILWGSKWQLVARDAFNGVVLWRKDIARWTSRLWPLKSGPATTPRRLVAIGDHVYFTPGLLAPVTKFDGPSGATLKVYAGTERTDEIVYREGVLHLVINPHIDPNQRGGLWKRTPKKVMAVREADGGVLWQKEYPWVAPCTLAVVAEKVYLSDGPHVVALDPRTGKQLWKSRPLPQRDKMPTYFAPTLVAVAGGVLYAGGENWREHAGSKGLMTFLDARTGEVRWQRPHLPSGYQSPQDIFVIAGQAWCGSTNSKPGEFDKRYPEVAPSTGEFISYDLQSGKPAGRIPRGADSYWFHHRCHRAKATERFLLTSRTGIEMIDVRTGKWHLHHWVRGACVYGIMPANGLIYAPPHPCACYPEAKLTGFNAVAGGRTYAAADKLSEAERLVRGPAYDWAGAQAPRPEAAPGDWPTFRGSMARSGSTPHAVPTDLKRKWQVKVGGRLCQPVVAGGKVLVAAIDEHAVIALDRGTGKIAWTFLAGGRVDSPPTLYRGLALFGCADGYVYCLRASDGELAWRFRAAPYDRRIVAQEQLESVWPVHGSVLIRKGVLYVVAGRSAFLDGGLTLYRLNPLNGRVLSRVKMDEKDPNTGKDLHSHIKVLSMPVASPDILSCDGKNIYMRSQPLDPDGKRNRVAQVGLDKQRGEDAHLFAPNGFLDDDWWHRSFWVYGRGVLGGPGYSATGKSAPCGKIMVLDDKNVYVFGRRAKYWRWTTPMEFRLFAVDRRLPRPSKPADTGGRRARTRGRGGLQYAELWSVELPVLVRAMVKAGETIFAAGPADVADEQKALGLTRTSEAIPPELEKQERLFAGEAGSVLWAVSAKDGRKRAEIKLDVLPVFDGLIAAGGELYMASVDGKVICLRGAAK